MNREPAPHGPGSSSAPRQLSRGLPSIEEARRERKKLQWMPPRFWAWTAVILAASFVYWWKKEEGELQTMRNELLARQRAVAAELGPRWFPLRDKIEAWTTECANSDAEVADRAVLRAWDFRSKPGIYLRLGKAEAVSPETIRTAAKQSLRDGFTACLLVVPNANPLEGESCQSNKDCPPKQQCNEFDHCAAHGQPYNLRLAYRTMWPMTDEWIDDVQGIEKKLTMRGAVATFQDWNTYDLPVAVDLLTQATYFLVVVDEPAEGETTVDLARAEPADGGLGADRSISSKPHAARVCAWRLSDDKRVLTLRRDAAGHLVGSQAAPDVESVEAQRRQANSCALALSVREAMGEDTGARLPADALSTDAASAPSAGSTASAAPSATGSAASPPSAAPPASAAP